MTSRAQRELEREALSEARRAAALSARAQQREAQSLGSALTGFLDSSGLSLSLADARVLRAWQEVTGDRLSRRAKAVRFHQGELLVEVRSSAHLTELKAFTGEDYRQRANQRLRRDAIQRVSFKLAQ